MLIVEYCNNRNANTVITSIRDAGPLLTWTGSLSYRKNPSGQSRCVSLDSARCLLWLQEVRPGSNAFPHSQCFLRVAFLGLLRASQQANQDGRSASITAPNGPEAESTQPQHKHSLSMDSKSSVQSLAGLRALRGLQQSLCTPSHG